MTHPATTLAVNEFGDPQGDPVVLLSSIATTHETWASVLPALERYRVITIDHRGHGASPTPDVAPGETSMEDLAQDVLSLIDAHGIHSFSIIGVSLGGAIAQWIAAHTDRVERAVFVATATTFGGKKSWDEDTTIVRAQGMESMVDGFLSICFTGEFEQAHPETVARIREMAAATDAEGYAQCGDALATWDFEGELPKITCPVLTVAGAQDPGTPPDAVAVIAGGVSGPATSVVVDPGAHLLTVENPDAFNQALIEFLQ